MMVAIGNSWRLRVRQNKNKRNELNTFTSRECENWRLAILIVWFVLFIAFLSRRFGNRSLFFCIFSHSKTFIFSVLYCYHLLNQFRVWLHVSRIDTLSILHANGDHISHIERQKETNRFCFEHCLGSIVMRSISGESTAASHTHRNMAFEVDNQMVIRQAYTECLELKYSPLRFLCHALIICIFLAASIAEHKRIKMVFKCRCWGFLTLHTHTHAFHTSGPRATKLKSSYFKSKYLTDCGVLFCGRCGWPDGAPTPSYCSLFRK